MGYFIGIETNSSMLSDATGSPANGRIIITPNAPFEWDSPTGRQKVDMHAIVVYVLDGKFTAPVQLIPTHNAGHDTNNITYAAVYDMKGKTWVETWTLDGTGPSVLEITDVAIQKTSISPTSVVSVQTGKTGRGLIEGGIAGQVLGKRTATDYDMTWLADPLDRANHYGQQPTSSIAGLGNAATKNIGTGSGMVASGDHRHTGIYEPANPQLQAHLQSTSNPHKIAAQQVIGLDQTTLNGGYF